MPLKPSRFARKAQHYKQQPKVLVICEDSVSSPGYLDEAAVYFRVNVDVLVVHIGKTDPLGIVQEAIKKSGSYDKVFCVIDRDNHQNFDEALAAARGRDRIKVIASYPCFEYWYLLHFGPNRSPFKANGSGSAGDHCIKNLRGCKGMDKYEKGAKKGSFELLFPLFGDARKFAPIVLDEAIRDKELNPSTEVHLLIDFFELLAKPQLI